jgi:ABC-type transport system substrate-binding protein
LLLKPESSEVVARVKDLRKSYQRFQYGEPARILGFDPVLNDSPAERRIQRFLFSGLVRHQRDPLALAESTYSLDLARSIRPSPDGRKLYIALRKDLHWSDGELISAEDVLATIQVMCASETPNRDAMLARLIDLPNCQIRSADNLVLSLNFSTPRPRMILDFAVLPRRQLGDPPKITAGSALANSPISSAAFTLEKIDGPTTILLGREGFVPPGEPEGRWPVLSEVRVTSFADPTTARTRLENQQIDLLTELHPADVQRLQANGQFKVEHQPANQVTFLAFNHRQKVFQGRTGFLLRKSINLAIDRETLLRENYQARRGLGAAHRSLTGPFPRSSYAYDEGLPGYSFNPTLARQTLLQSRQKDLTLRLIHLPDPIVTSVCVLIKKQLQEIGEDQGLQIRLVKLTPALFRKAIESRSFDIAYCNHSYDRPLLDLETLLADGETGEGGRNYMGYRHPDLARTFDLLRMTDLWTKISALSQELHRHCHENAVMVPLWQLDSYFAYAERLEGLDLHPSHLFGAPWSLRVR